MKLICINGGKNSKKDLLALRLASNSDCVWIHPYSDKSVPPYEDEDRFISLNKNQLDDKILKEVPLVEVVVNDNRFVFFENQLSADYVVILGDDRVVTQLKNNWKGKLITVRCHSGKEEYSERNLLPDKEFDIVYNYETDDFDTFVAEVEDINDFEVK